MSASDKMSGGGSGKPWLQNKLVSWMLGKEGKETLKARGGKRSSRGSVQDIGIVDMQMASNRRESVAGAEEQSGSHAGTDHDPTQRRNEIEYRICDFVHRDFFAVHAQSHSSGDNRSTIASSAASSAATVVQHRSGVETRHRSGELVQEEWLADANKTFVQQRQDESGDVEMGDPDDIASEFHRNRKMASGKTWISGRQYPVVQDRVFFMALKGQNKLRELNEWQQRSGLSSDTAFVCIDQFMEYFPFCSDFGPLNLANVYKFCVRMKQMLAQQQEGGKMALYTMGNSQARACAATLLGSWLILDLGWSAGDAFAPFDFAGKSPFMPFRDASYEPCTFPLSVLDVLSGLYRAKCVGLLDLNTFDLEWYEHCDHPANADLHMLVPGLFVAFKGPHAEKKYYPESGVVDLTANDYIDIFKRMNVTTVVRLNSRIYDRDVFIKAGLTFHELFFEDCSTPNEDVIERWFNLYREHRRKGTLIAMYLMRKYRFKAKEVIGYLRVLRPGSVLGSQQQFLEMNEELFWNMGDPDIYDERILRGRKEVPVDAQQQQQQQEQQQPMEMAAQMEEARRRAAEENTEAMNRNCADRMRHHPHHAVAPTGVHTMPVDQDSITMLPHHMMQSVVS